MVQAGAFATVPVDTKSLPPGTPQGGPFVLSAAVRGLRRPGQIRWLPVAAIDDGGTLVSGRVCALRKTGEAIRLAHNDLRSQASKKGAGLQLRTLEHAEYVILFTPFRRRPSRVQTCWSGIACKGQSRRSTSDSSP